jgi:hypothetical protein
MAVQPIGHQDGSESRPLGEGSSTAFDPKQLRVEKIVPERRNVQQNAPRGGVSETSRSVREEKPKAVPDKRHPLGLPAGSVRALLCLVVLAFLVLQTARGVRVDVVWNEALMIMLAHYFTTRRFVPLSSDLRAKLEATGEIEPDENPLHLPKHSVRILMIAAFGGLAIYLHDQQRLFEPQSLSLLVSVGAYLLGITVRGVLAWWSQRTGIKSPDWWSDLKALATIGVVLTAVGLQLIGAKMIFGLDSSRLQDFSLGLVLYYFGSR